MKQEIAIEFSNGKFKENYKYLADDIEWYIFGENLLQGKESVIKHCEQIALYFRSVNTAFETYDIIEGPNEISINGRAEFCKNDSPAVVVNSCDIYRFNDQGFIENIRSYCITESE